MNRSLFLVLFFCVGLWFGASGALVLDQFLTPSKSQQLGRFL